jgi:hypothetical protein
MPDLWGLVWGKPEVDPEALARAIEAEVKAGELDFRTRLLIRDGTKALEQFWGKSKWGEWLKTSAVRREIQVIRQERLGTAGFPSLKERIVERLDPETVHQYLRELGSRLGQPVRLRVGGAVALIVQGQLERATEDIDVVDEVPPEIRELHPFLEELRKRYGLRLTHFQSHYLPAGWEGRLQSLGTFGKLRVDVVDIYDLFLGKLFSKRSKDRDDLRMLKPRLDRRTLVRRLRNTTGDFLKDPALRKTARDNWYVVFGDELPAGVIR